MPATTLSPGSAAPLRQHAGRARAKAGRRTGGVTAVLAAALALGSASPALAADDAPAARRMSVLATDGYFDVSRIDPSTFAILESHYWQLNILYVLKGEKRSILFDSGSGTRDVAFVADKVTKKPMTVVASHLHYDHMGSMGSFASVAMIDLPETRAATDGDGWFSPPISRTFWPFVPGFHVTEWWKDGDVIDLGDRSIEVVSLPGHSADSIALVDRERGYAFVGDHLYGRFPLLAHLPGSDLAAYLASTRRLLRDFPEIRTVFGAHADGRMTRESLVALEGLLSDILEHRIHGQRVWWLGWMTASYERDGVRVFAAP